MIPSRCVGFEGASLFEENVQQVTFEDDDDIELGGFFSGSDALQTVTLPQGQTTIPAHSFQSCNNLERITIPENVEILENLAFSGCEALEEVDFPDGKLTTIEKECFRRCTSLKEIVLPDGLTTIEDNAFFGCSALEKVTFGASIQEIGFAAFQNTGVKEVHFPEDAMPEHVTEAAFGADANDRIAYIAQGSWLDQHREVLEKLYFSEIRYE